MTTDDNTAAEAMDLSVGPPGTPDLADAAPAFDPLGDQDDTWDDEPAAALGPLVTEPMVRGVLAGLVGGGLHLGLTRSGTAAREADLWRFTDTELDELTPPLTRIIAARPALARAVTHGDELTVAVALSRYLGRNVTTARALREQADAEADAAEAARLHPDPDPAEPGGVTFTDQEAAPWQP